MIKVCYMQIPACLSMAHWTAVVFAGDPFQEHKNGLGHCKTHSSHRNYQVRPLLVGWLQGYATTCAWMIDGIGCTRWFWPFSVNLDCQIEKKWQLLVAPFFSEGTDPLRLVKDLQGWPGNRSTEQFVGAFWVCWAMAQKKLSLLGQFKTTRMCKESKPKIGDQKKESNETGVKGSQNGWTMIQHVSQRQLGSSVH